MSYSPYIAKIRHVLLLQVSVALLFPVVWLMAGRILDAKSALIGGVVAVLPNLIFAVKLIRSIGQPHKQIEKTLYWGEFLKLVTTGLLFGLVILYIEISFLPLLLGFAAVLSVFWFSLLT
ncbi:MAG: ATP synthase subunit I [Gammaproteobacteria bacterium]|nr:ATP synthase subunit I [Gammaproteobacteria bacterium]